MVYGQEFSKTQQPYLAVNYIKNAGIESGVTGYSLFNDGTSVNPVDGIGGTATITLTSSTTNPLVGTRSLIVTKPSGSSHQGQGFSSDFTIANADRGKVIRSALKYEIASGTYATGDMTLWIYDVTNTRLIQPSAYIIEKSGLQESKFVEWQSSIDSNLYRLIVHISSTSTAAYSLKFDSFESGLGPKVYGSVITDAVVATYTLTNAGSATVTGTVERRGEKAVFRGRIGIGSSLPTGTITLNLPSGYTLATFNEFKEASITGVPANTNQVGTAFANSATSFNFYGPTGTSAWNATTPATWANGNYIDFTITAKIVGWSSSQVMSDQSDTRIVAARYYASTTSVGTTFTTVIHPNKTFDTHGAYNSFTGEYRVPVPGLYKVSTFLQGPGIAFTVSQTADATIYKNGVDANSPVAIYSATGSYTARPMLQGSGYVEAVAGDVLTLRMKFPSASPIDVSTNWVSFERVSGPSQIASSEFVGAKYTSSSGQSIPSAVRTIVDFATKEYDTHNSVTTGASWKFTAPISGTYRVSYSSTFASASWVNGNLVLPELRKGGSIIHGYDIVIQSSFTNSYTVFPLVTTVRLLAGEYIDATLNQNTGSSKSLVNTSLANHIEIERIGSY